MSDTFACSARTVGTERVLADRRRATEGARSDAAASLTRAEQRAAEYQESIRAARNDIYREHEEQRRQWRDDQSARVADARRRADELVKQSREQLARDVEEARGNLEGQSRSLADEITRTVLEGAAR